MTYTVQRSTPQNGRPNPRRDEALSRLRDGDTVSDVATFAGVHRSTVTRWARAEGIDPGTNTQHTRMATAARAAHLNANTIERLEYLIELASTGLIRRLEANADAAEVDDNDLGEWCEESNRFAASTPAARAVLRRWRHLNGLEPTRDLIRALTSAIHDLTELHVDTAERGAVIVNFGIPRPVDDGDVLDVSAIEE